MDTGAGVSVLEWLQECKSFSEGQPLVDRLRQIVLGDEGDVELVEGGEVLHAEGAAGRDVRPPVGHHVATWRPVGEESRPRAAVRVGGVAGRHATDDVRVDAEAAPRRNVLQHRADEADDVAGCALSPFGVIGRRHDDHVNHRP